MKTAREMYKYCIDNKYGSSWSKNKGEKHFGIIVNNLQTDEVVLMTFIGLHNYISMTKHNDNCAFAITNKRILIGRKKFVGEFFQSVQLNMLNDITMNSGFAFGTITFDTMKEKFNVLLDKEEANNILQKIHDVIYGEEKVQNFLKNDSKTDSVLSNNGGIICPECSFNNSVGSKFCSECGFKLLFCCTNCGNSINLNDKFCNECGTKNESYTNNLNLTENNLNKSNINNEDMDRGFYKVKLTYSRDKIKTIKIIHGFTNLKLKEAKKIVDHNDIICEKIDLKKARDLENKLKRVGTEVSILEQ